MIANGFSHVGRKSVPRGDGYRGEEMGQGPTEPMPQTLFPPISRGR